MRTLDPWVSLGRLRGDVTGPAFHRGGAARGTRSDHPGKKHRDAGPPVRWPGQRRRRFRLEHRRARRPQRAARAAPHHVARVHRSDAGVVDAGRSRLRRRVRQVRAQLGVAQPVQSHVPVLVGAAGNEKNFKWIARSADGWITTPRDFDIDEPVKLLQDIWAAAGRDGAPQIVALDFKPVPEKLAKWAELGVTEVLFGLPDRPEDEIAAYVERLAGKLASLGLSAQPPKRGQRLSRPLSGESSGCRSRRIALAPSARGARPRSAARSTRRLRWSPETGCRRQPTGR